MGAHRFFRPPQLPLGVRIATRREELLEAFGLVYQCYVLRNYVQPNPGGIVYKEEFGFPTSRTLIATAPDDVKDVVGTLTLVGDSSAGLDIEQTYPKEVQELRDLGRSFAEVTCLAISRAKGFGPREIFYRLTQFMIQYSYWHGYDDLLLAVHPRHHRFYWECFRVYPLGPCRTYHSANGNPSVCCRIDLNHLRRNVSSSLWHKYFDECFPEIEYGKSGIAAEDHAWLCRHSGIAVEEEKAVA